LYIFVYSVVIDCHLRSRLKKRPGPREASDCNHSAMGRVPLHLVRPTSYFGSGTMICETGMAQLSASQHLSFPASQEAAVTLVLI